MRCVSPAAQAITRASHGLGAALDKTSQLMSDQARAAADAACLALAALHSMGSSVTLCSPDNWSHCGHSAQHMNDETCRGCCCCSFGTCCAHSVVLLRQYICLSLIAHAALIAHNLGCENTVVVGLLITALGDWQ